MYVKNLTTELIEVIEEIKEEAIVIDYAESEITCKDYKLIDDGNRGEGDCKLTPMDEYMKCTEYYIKIVEKIAYHNAGAFQINNSPVLKFLLEGIGLTCRQTLSRLFYVQDESTDKMIDLCLTYHENLLVISDVTEKIFNIYESNFDFNSENSKLTTEMTHIKALGRILTGPSIVKPQHMKY